MPSLNKAQIIGHLGQDPELKYMPSGDAVCNLSVATSEAWKDKQSGEQKERTEWHRVVLFRRVAEVAGQYLKKGSLVMIEGKLKTRKWQDKSGNDRYTTEIEGRDMLMLGSRGGNQAQGNPAEHHAGHQAPNHPSKEAPQAEFEDDIPF